LFTKYYKKVSSQQGNNLGETAGIESEKHFS